MQYKIQMCGLHNYTLQPFWITIVASSDTEARTKAYAMYPNLAIACCKEWTWENVDSYFN